MSDRTPIPKIDVLRRPEITEEIPTGATLPFHEVSLPSDSQPVRLTAFRPCRSRRWSVRVTGIGDLDAPTPTLPTSRWLLSISPLVAHATWGSSAEAFAAVAWALQRANELHLLAG